MSVSIDQLLDVLAEITADAGDEAPVLIGGLAVHLRTRSAEVLVSPAEAARDPVLLESVVRPTQDIDLATARQRTSSLVVRLEQLGFSLTATPRRYCRDDVSVDILTPEVPYTGFVLLPDQSGPVALPGGGLSSPVATLDALVMTKSHAWSTRKEERDLVDLARIALADLRMGWLPPRLAEHLKSEPMLFDLFQSVRQEFATHDGLGPDVFFQAVQAAALGIEAVGWLEHEQDIRELVSLAVGRMFQDCALDEE